MADTSLQPELVAPVSLLETLKSIEEGTLTPSRSIAQRQDRIEACEPHIHAFAHRLDDPGSLADAATGPLRGIALAVKDIFNTADLPSEYNSPIYKGHRPISDAAIVALAKNAGCTLMGKSVTTEMAFFDPGPTRNPHNLDHTPGGSSSGSAAAVAAGMVHLAIGTQTGGSVIRPAAFCGVTGFKPSSCLLPKVGMKTFSWSLDTVGLFTATVADIAFATSALTGRNLKIETDHSFDTPKLGVVRSHNWSDADPDYRTQFEALLRSLSTFGVELIDIQPSDNYIAASHAHQIIQDYEARQALAWEHTNHSDKMSDVLRQTLDFAATIKPSDYDDARVAADLALSEMNEHFEEIDAFISLSTPGPAPHGLASTGSPIFNRIWSLFGLPCVNVPGLMSPTGLPLGVQIIGPYLADHDTLQIAHWLEGAIKRHLDR